MTSMNIERDSACAIYVRLSSAGGNGSNRSLAEQEVEVRALAATRGLPVVQVYAEKEGTGASRYSRKRRPVWESALADLEAGDRFRTLVVFAHDRADRRGADEMAKVIRRHAETGRSIIGCDGTDTGDPHRRMETIVRLEVAAEEVDRLSYRVTRTKRHRRADGRWLGGLPPYGVPCGRPANQVDHIERGDDHSLNNLRAPCRACPATKSAKEGAAARRPRHRREPEVHPAFW